MPPIAETVPASPSRTGLARAAHWSLEGLRLWRRAPWMLLGLCAIQLLAEALLQLVPWAGVTLSKLIVPLLAMGVLLGLDELARGGRLRLACLLGCFRRGRLLPALGLVVLWGLAVFAVQQWVVYLIYGWPAVDAVTLGHMHAHPALLTLNFSRLLILSGVPLSVLLMMAAPLFLFRGLSPWKAVKGGVRIVLAQPVAFTGFALLVLALYALMLSSSWSFALVLLIMPWATATTYAIWRDVSTHAPAPGPDPIS